ncbi:MAG: lipopolysaccharide heptosyltransferase II [Candidatus Omnitrophota bacterium]|nr:lipopolysaccharide heptosyltransferase II [Candidatus Omnitrophota bacterium]
MKVLQVLPSLDVGGVERGVIDLARAMRKRGEEIVVISSGGALVAQLHKMGVTHYALPVHRKSLFSLALVPRIARIIQREHVDVVHARSRVPAWLAWLAARQTQTPFVTTCHGYYSNHLLSRVMGWGKRVIVISRIIGRHMIDDFGVSPERIRLIHRGLDLQHFTHRPIVKRTPRIFRILNIGRLSPIKGQLEFLRAVHLLRRDLQQIEVCLVGSEGKGKHKYTELLKQTVRQLGLEACVKFLGTRRDIPELLRGADLLVLSTLVPEAFGRVVIEAGAVGCPVVSTRVGGVLDIIDEGENGRLVPPGDPEAMAAAMFDSLTSVEQSTRLAENLRKKVENNFTLDQLVDKTIAVYDEVKKEKKILVIKLGAMGDVILAVPSLRMLRERFPDASISVLVDKKFAPLLKGCPYIQEVIPVERRRFPRLLYLLRLAKSLRREGYDASVDLQNSKWTHLLAFLAAIPERFGFRRGHFGFLLNRPDRFFRVAEPPVKNQYRILSKVGVQKWDDRLELWPDAKSEKKVDEVLEEFLKDSNSSRLVGFVLGSSPKWLTKRWPLENFKALARRLQESENTRVVLIGSAEDGEIADQFLAGETAHVLNMVGKTSSRELIPLVKRLDVLVTGDTAPLHVASAVGTDIVALFGPTDPKRHMPPGNNHVVINRRLACQPCYRGTCSNEEDLACLRQISIEEVFNAVRKKLNSLVVEARA